MKKILLLLILFVTGLGLNAQCDYELDLWDSWGDGWNGSSIEVFVDLASVGVYTTTAGASTLVPITVNTGEVISFVFTSGGTYPNEVGWALRDPSGAIIEQQGFAYGLGPINGGGTPIPTNGTTYTAACPTCLPPTALNATSVTETGATLEWVASATPGATYNWEVQPMGTAQGTLTPVGLSGTGGVSPVAVTGLTSGTPYDFYIESDCGVAGTNFASGSFTTLPSCGDNVSGLCYSVNGTEVLLSFSASPGDWAEIDFNAGQVETCCDAVQVWDGLNGTGNLLYTSQLADYSSVPSVQSTTGNISLVVQADGSVTCATNGYTSFDVDVNCVTPPTCLVPTAISTSSVTSTSANVDFTCTGCTGSYIVEYGATSGFVAGTAGTVGAGGIAVVTGGASPIGLSGLTANTTYYYTIRQDCGGDYSANATEGSFTTLCAVETPYYSEDFTSFLNPCWEEAGSGDFVSGPIGLGAGDWQAGTALGSSARINLFSNTDQEWLLSPLFDLSGTGYEVVLDVAVTNWNSADPDAMGSDDYVSLAYTEDAGLSWITLNTWTVADALANSLTTFNYNIPSAGASVQFAILASDGSVDDGEDYDFHIDNFIVRTPPTCAAPTAAATFNVGTASAEFNWDGSASPFGLWHVEYGPPSFVPGTGTVLAVPANVGVGPGMDTAWVSGLMANTTYDWYVSNVCGPGDTSLPLGPNTFTTLETCFQASALMVNGNTFISADVSWTPGTTGTAHFVVEYGAPGFTPGTGAGTPIVVAADTFTTISGLTAETSYDWYVKDSCGMGDVGSWSIASNFFTGYCIPNYTSGTTLGDLISEVSITGTTLLNNTGVVNGTPAYTYYNGGGSQTADLQAGTSYDVVITAGDYAFGGQNFTAWIDFNDNLIFEESERIGSTSSATTTAYEVATFTISLPCNPSVGVHRLRVRDVWNTTGSAIDPCAQAGFGETEDYDVNVIAPPPCPQISNLVTFGTITDTSADFDWHTGCAETAWDYEVNTSATPPAAAPANVLHADTFVNAMGLMASTVYYAHVRANCGGTTSDWSTISFTTAAAPPANDDCAGAIALTVNLDGTCTATTTFDNAGATFSAAEGAPSGACSDGDIAPLDLWFTALVPASGEIDFEFLSVPGASSLVELYTGTCGSLVALAPVNCVNTGVRTFSGLLAGSTVYLRVWDFGSDQFGDTEVCLQGLNCAAPIVGTTIVPDCGNNQFSVDIEVADLGSGTSYDLEVNGSTIGAPITTTATITVGPYASGTVLDIALIHNVDNACDYTETGLTYSCPPANDLIGGAIAMVCGATETVNTTFATSDVAMGVCAGGFTGTFDPVDPGNGVWYSFVGTGEEVQVSLCASGFDTELYLYSGPFADTCMTSNDDGALCTVSTNRSAASFISSVGVQYFFLAGGYAANTGDIEISVTCIPVGVTVWNGSVDSDYSNAANWTGTFPTTCLDDVFIPLTANNPDFTGAFECNNFGTAASVNPTVSIAGQVDVCGHVDLATGTDISGDGVMRLLGTTTGGAGTFDVVGTATIERLRVVAPYAATGNIDIVSALEMDGGTFDASAATVTLKSGIGFTAYFDDFSFSGGAYIGSMTSERFVSNGAGEEQHMVSSPINSAPMSELGDDVSGNGVAGLYGADGIAVTVDDCNAPSLAQGSNYGNVFEYDESIVGSCELDGWIVRSSGNMMNARGYSAYVNSGSTIDYSGSPNTGHFEILGLLNTPSGTVGAGWHLLGNPYPSPMNSDAITANGLTSAQYYVVSGPFTGTYTGYTPGQPVAVGQGFVANAFLGSSEFKTDDIDRIAANNPAWYSVEEWFTSKLEIVVMGNGFGDKATLFYSENNTASFDAIGDCVKKDSKIGQPTIYTNLGDQELGLNGNALAQIGESVPMGVKPGADGTFTLSFTGLETFEEMTTIYVEDKLLGTYHNVANGEYVYTSTTSDNNDRFVIHFVLPVELATTNVDCQGNLGNITLESTDGSAERNFVLAQGATTISTDDLANLNAQVTAGEYVLTVSDVFGGNQVYDVAITEADAIVAAMEVSSLNVEVGELVNFNNLTANATDLEWTINGSVINGVNNATYTFDEVGIYPVLLDVSNEDCRDTKTVMVEVTNKTTSIIDVDGNQSIKVYSVGTELVLEFINSNNATAILNVENILGQRVHNGTISTEGTQRVNIADVKTGYYFVSLNIAGTNVSTKVLLTNR